jgi:hypothetical protein
MDYVFTKWSRQKQSERSSLAAPFCHTKCTAYSSHQRVDAETKKDCYLLVKGVVFKKGVRDIGVAAPQEA